MNRLKTQSVAASVQAMMVDDSTSFSSSEDPATVRGSNGVTMKDQISSFRIPSNMSTTLSNRSSTSSSSSPLMAPPPSQLSLRRQRPLSLQLTDVTERTPYFASDSRSQQPRASSVPLSPFLRTLSPVSSSSPAFSHGTFGSSSPALSTSGSSYFSNATDFMSPPTPSSLASPTSTFFKLSLESPLIPSPRSDTGRFPSMSEGSSQASQIRLPPIILPVPWERRPSSTEHQRSSSDVGPPDTKLPSFRSLVVGVDVGRPNPPSPPHFDTRYQFNEDPRFPQPQTSPHSSRGAPPRHRPSSLTHILPRTEEEPAGSPRQYRHHIFAPEPQALGLGMLALAASEGLDPGEKERKYTETRRMSCDM